MEEMLKRYWKRRDYESIKHGKRAKVRRLGQTRRKKWTFRMKLKPRLKSLSRLFSPKKLLIRFRDKYVKMMLRVAQSNSAFSGGGGDKNMVMGFGNEPLKEYDNSMILEIYKSLMAQDKLINDRDTDLRNW